MADVKVWIKMAETDSKLIQGWFVRKAIGGLH